jgi:hypothetical protein
MLRSQPQNATLVAIRAAHHREAPAYDRVVFEFSGFIPLMQIEYVKQLLGIGSGLPVRIAGGAILLVQFTAAQAHNDRGQATAPTRLATRLPGVKEVVSAGDFEGVVSYGIGLARKAETRIRTLASPYRVVVDVLV